MTKEIHVLMLEDDPQNAEMIRALLQDQENIPSLKHARFMAEALGMLRGNVFDVAILDLSLPDSEGMETFRTIADLRPDLPVVVLTGSDDEQLALRIIKAGAQDYLIKGQFNRLLLVRAIHYAIERKMIEQAVRASEEEWRNTFDTIGDMIFIQDRDFKITRANRAFLQAMQLHPEEVVGRRCYDLVHGTEAPIAKCPCVKTCQDMSTCSEEVWDPLRKRFYHISTSPLIRSGEFRGAIHVARDITTQKKTNEELRETQAQLLQSEKMAVVGQMSAGITHEIKNPLSTILLSIDCMKANLGEDPCGVGELVGMLEESARRINKVVNELLSFSRTPQLKTQRIDLHAVLDTARRLLEDKAEQKAVSFIPDYFPEKIAIDGDKVLIEQAFYNLFSNALDAIEKEGVVKVATRLLLPEESPERGVRVEIADSGCGIGEEQLENIFKPFFTTKDYGKGTGLGLSIVKMIVERHHGTITVSSQKDAGTTFCVTMPLPPI